MGSKRTTLAETLTALDRLGADSEPITASELAGELDCAREVAAERLDELADQGDVNSKQVGDGTRVWWRPPDSGTFDQARFRSLVEAVDEYAIFMLDPDGYVGTWNEGARRIKGYDEAEIVGEHFSTFYTEEDREEGRPDRNLATAREEGHVEDEGWRVRKDGTEFWANVFITAIRDDDGALRGFAKVTRDMTERREREEQLRRERDQTEQILETSPVPISVRDADGDIVLANERTQELLEQSAEELQDDPEITDGVDIYDADGEPVSGEDLPAEEVRETGEPVFDRDLAVEKSDGERRWLSVNAAPVYGPDGDLERIITAGEDVTALKERERELEIELSEIFGRISDAFYALDEEYRFTHVNDRAEELLRHSEEELLGENLWEMFPEAAEEEDVWDSFHAAMETQEPTSYELYFEPLDFWVEANVYPSETGVSVYFRDVSERIERERELRESERRYRTLAENFPNGIVTLFDDELRYTLAAGEAFDRVEASPDDLEGRTPSEVWNEDDVAETLETACRSALEGNHESVEVEYAGREWVVYTVPITDDDGDVFAGMTMGLDITERKEREKRLERFASVISHGLRNPLEIAQIYLTMARDGGDPDDFKQVKQALDRMETIVQNLLTTTLQGQTMSQTEPVSLPVISENAWQNVETRNATLEIDDSVGSVVADGEQLQTALENLFRNAVEHGSTSSRPPGDNAVEHGSTSPPSQAQEDAVEHGSTSPRSQDDDAVEHGSTSHPPEADDAVEYGDDDVTVRVGRLDQGFYVEDDGPGIPPENRDEVFEYGYTSQSGTGIGLAVVRDVADAHGWDVSVTSGPEGGARFEITGVELGSDDR